MNWEQSTANFSLESVLDQLDRIRSNYGGADFELNDRELKTLIAEIKRQLQSDKIKEENRKYNKVLSEMLHTSKEPFLSLDDVVIAIGNYNNETKKQLETLAAKLGPMGPKVSKGRYDNDRKSDTKSGGLKRNDYHREGGRKSDYQKDSNAQKKARFDADRPRRDDSTKPECNGCGRNHDGECSLKGHPNYNKGPEPWAESMFGKAFATLKGKDAWTKLPQRSMLSSDLKTLVPYNRSLNFKIFSINLNNPVNNEQATFEWKPQGLIDSGALNGGPYVDKNLADKLFRFNKEDFKIINTKNVKIKVPFKGSSSSSTSIRLCIQLSHNDSSVIINESFIIVKDLGNDIIIDEDTIKKYKLTIRREM
jgi:hypothetical protein